MEAYGQATPIRDCSRDGETGSGASRSYNMGGPYKSNLRDNKQAESLPNSSIHLLNGGNEQQPNVGNGPSSLPAGDGAIVCGPLLNYNGMTNAGPGKVMWHGSVLFVTSGEPLPEMRFKYQGPWDETGLSSAVRMTESNTSSRFAFEDTIAGVKLYEDSGKAFWRFTISLPLQDHEACWVYSIANKRLFSGPSPSSDGSRLDRSHVFVVPSYSQSMRIMFHSCNGFSVGTDEDAWSGPALWNDVLRNHAQKPFHVMIGGGDQIYNDSVRVKGPLKAWTQIKNPRRRREYSFNEAFRAECDSYYYENYVDWYSNGQFARANSQIPQINIWDDHDIIDGFGSYTDHFMNCAVFRGIGSIAFKYYCLFQHHVSPPTSTLTTSSSQTAHSRALDVAGADSVQPKNSHVRNDQSTLDSFILGAHPGPYIQELSRSLYMRLGARLAFLGVDARTERTRMQVNYPDTYDLIFERVNSELSSANTGDAQQGGITHLIVLLGVPIAYPRLIFLENILRSPIIGPIRTISRRFGVAGGLFNHFDGGVDLLDDLDDHYTARHHKDERRKLMVRLQNLAKQHGIRITILGGDVHLAAVGRFYSKPKFAIPAEQDHRYMVNIISSAITNKPPPRAVADLLARRNKIHHLNHDTDETLMIAFDKDPGTSSKTATSNKVTMPSRNYAIISEAAHSTNSPVSAKAVPANGHVTNGLLTNGDTAISATAASGKTKAKDGHSALHPGEVNAGSKHVAASGVSSGDMKGGLDVCLRIEIDQHDGEGKTEGYGFSIPALKLHI